MGSNFKRNYKTQLKKDFNNLWPMLEESFRRLEEGIQQGITWNNLPSRVFAGRRRLRDEYKFYDFYEHMMSELNSPLVVNALTDVLLKGKGKIASREACLKNDKNMPAGHMCIHQPSSSTCN